MGEAEGTVVAEQSVRPHVRRHTAALHCTPRLHAAGSNCVSERIRNKFFRSTLQIVGIS